ncbi:hypothetical protein LPJ62_005727, partial [Coemansia sp. RSA 2167]
MNATDMMQSLSPSASPGMSPLVRFRHSCEHCRKRKIKCSGTRPVCDHCLRRSIPCEYKPQAKTLRRARGSPSAYSKRSSRVQPISIPAVNMFLPLQMASAHSAPNPMPSPNMQLRPASAIPSHLSNSSTMLSPNSPLAFGYSPNDASTPSSFTSNGFASNASTPSMWNGLGFENAPEISINGLIPESDPALYNVHSQPQTAPAGSSTFDSASFKFTDSSQQLEPMQHRRSMTDESANSASNVPLIERSANVGASADPALFGFYAPDQQMSYSMPSFPGTSMHGANNSALQFFKPDETAYMNLVDSYAMPQQSYSMQPYPMQSYPTQSYPAQSYPAQSYPAQSYPAQSYPAQSYPAQSYPTPVPSTQKSSLGIAPELT